MGSNLISESAAAAALQTTSPGTISTESANLMDRAGSLTPQPAPPPSVNHRPSSSADGLKHEPTATTFSGPITTAVMESTSTSPGDTNIREGLGSVNRWSHSTASSKNSTDHSSHYTENHSRMLNTTDFDHPNGANPSVEMELLGSTPRVINSTTEPAICHGTTPDQGPADVVSPAAPVLELQGLYMSPAFSSGIMSAASAEGVVSSEQTFNPNNFQNPWSMKHETKRSQEMTANNFFHEYDPHLSTERRRRGHSQKAMLSKALQKANTAVLLDNAANFEGAMDAYSDACQLLQLVMLRSNGGKDEKLKLQEIVSSL